MKPLLLITCLLALLNPYAVFSQPAHQWTTTISGINNAGTNDIATDGMGNVFATGYFLGTATAGLPDTSVTLTSVEDKDIFLAKFSPSGDLLWAHDFGGNFDDEGFAVTTDNEGNVYMTGIIEDDADFDPSPETAFLLSAGLQDVIVTKYDPDGNFIWGFAFGDFLTDEGKDIAYDQEGFLYLTGGFRGTVDFDPGAGVTEVTGTSFTTDIFLAKYTLDGNLVWAKSMGGSSTDNVQALAYGGSGSGSIYLTGGFDSSIDLDPSAAEATHSAAGLTDIFISAYDTSGNYLWSHGFGSNSYDIAHDIGTDQSGNVLVTGNFCNTVNFSTTGGTLEVTSNAQSDIFLAKFDADGNDEWALSAGAEGADEGLSLTTSSSGEVYVSGCFSNVADFDPGAGEYLLTSGGFYNIYFAGYSVDGNFLWAGNFDSPSSGYGRALDTDNADRILAGGEFQADTDFDINLAEYIIESEGGYDGFVSLFGECAGSSSTVAEEICYGDSYLFDGDLLTIAGTYFATFLNVDGCDSVVTLELSVYSVDTSVIATDTELTAVADGATYQWVDCNDAYTPVAGADEQEFTPINTGDYAVIVTMNGCSDTSGCYFFEKQATNAVEGIDPFSVLIYPNPADDHITIILSSSSEINILNMTGEVIYFNNFSPGLQTIRTGHLPAGVYLLMISDVENRVGTGLFEIK